MESWLVCTCRCLSRHLIPQEASSNTNTVTGLCAISTRFLRQAEGARRCKHGLMLFTLFHSNDHCAHFSQSHDTWSQSTYHGYPQPFQSRHHKCSRWIMHPCEHNGSLVIPVAWQEIVLYFKNLSYWDWSSPVAGMAGTLWITHWMNLLMLQSNVQILRQIIWSCRVDMVWWCPQHRFYLLFCFFVGTNLTTQFRILVEVQISRPIRLGIMEIFPSEIGDSEGLYHRDRSRL